MKKKKLFYRLFIVCFMTLILTNISGCSTKVKSKKIITLQKKRIRNLEKQLLKKNKVIGKLKANKWAHQTVKVDESISFSKLRSLVKKKNWVRALAESSRLKKTHPRSVTLRNFRIRIFSKMGLEDQAFKERMVIRKLRAQRVQNSLKR